MKSLVAILILVLTVAECFGSIRASPVVETGQLSGERYEARLDGHVSFLWDPESDEWLMSAKQASATARLALRKMIGAAEPLFELRSVSLHRFGGLDDKRKACWYFLVVFESLEERAGAKRDRIGIMPAILPFIVWPEGYVQSPTKAEPNKALEPTP